MNYIQETFISGI